jgi:hypothetical protein
VRLPAPRMVQLPVPRLVRLPAPRLVQLPVPRLVQLPAPRLVREVPVVVAVPLQQGVRHRSRPTCSTSGPGETQTRHRTS